MKRLVIALLAMLALSTLARSDGIYNPTSNQIGFTDGVNNLGVGISGPTILLSNATVASTATVGTTVGALSVINGSGSYTFTLTSNPGGLFAISVANLNVAAALTAGSDPITIHADNGVGGLITQPFVITVTAPVTNDALLADNSSPALLADNTNAACLAAGGC